MDPEDAAEVPLAILVARKAQVDHSNVTAVPSATLVTMGAQKEPREEGESRSALSRWGHQGNHSIS